MQKNIVLGAGIAGLSAAYHLKKLGEDVVVYEKNEYFGGLTSSFHVQGFRFDNAVHLSFTKDNYVRAIFDKTEYLTHSPLAYCYETGAWLKHPVQNNLHRLPISDRIDLIESFFERPNLEPENYQQWLITQYGEKIANRYPIPYTKKYWGLDSSELSLSWVGDRMRRAEVREILEGAFEQKNANHYYANEMRYPKIGGYESFLSPLKENVNIKLNHKVSSINVDAKEVRFENGQIEKYEILISTLPLPVIIPMIQQAPKNIKKSAKSLLYTRVDLISIGFSRPDVPPYLWFYIYDEKFLAARAYSPSMKSPDNVPDGCSSLQFEIYSLNNEPQLNPEKLKENIIKH